MFKQAATPTFWHPVKIEYTKEDSGQGVVSFDCQYKRMKISEVRALAAANEGADDADLLFMREVVVGWRKVPDDDGSEVPFSLDALQQMYDLGFGGAIVKTYFASFAKAKEKN